MRRQTFFSSRLGWPISTRNVDRVVVFTSSTTLPSSSTTSFTRPGDISRVVMKSLFFFVVAAAAYITSAVAHYTFPNLIVNDEVTGDWKYVRRTNNWQSRIPVKGVTGPEFRCFNTEINEPSETVTVSAGSTLGFKAEQSLYHAGVINIYMAKAPGNVADWDGDGEVWFKVYELPAITDGGNSMRFPAQGIDRVTFTIPPNLPDGEYLVRLENIALHLAETYGGTESFISCGQVKVVNGGNGEPGPKVAFPGAYSGYEPGVLINIYPPYPASYEMPGPDVWTG
ncbi:lytic polysaccharide monooxygenase [Sphaerobolus stellatus SS14]|uniref:lytic cellulose monooxygenase (C4-dehydrogenating) n=1 Tax=Sphaerobolus stellatus (strain SS14) TaxID=990650 RepID=A0A0C9V8W4_SPHS4|nr:lytic polysaccharide monooxygenase [Sphaerobolus stellatus SS14]